MTDDNTWRVQEEALRTAAKKAEAEAEERSEKRKSIANVLITLLVCITVVICFSMMQSCEMHRARMNQSIKVVTGVLP